MLRFLRKLRLKFRRQCRLLRWELSDRDKLSLTDKHGQKWQLVSTSGLGIVAKSKYGWNLFFINQVMNRREFLQSWYALGGAVIVDEHGVPVDPDDVG